MINASGCVSAASASLVINAQPVTPTAPIAGTITQPTCSVATGSVVLNGLPPSGTWTLTRTPGGVTTTGTGTSTTTSGLVTGTYTYTVTSASGCISVASANVVINAQPTKPTAPTLGIITQPTCAVATGSVVLSNLPLSGTWTLTRTPGGVTTTGTGSSTTLSLLAAGTYTYAVTNASGCASPASANVIINTSLSTPAAPIIGAITQTTCSIATGNVALGGLPSSGTWTLTRIPGGITTTGTGTSTTISLLAAGTYTYTVTNASGCVSVASANVLINVQPAIPSAPIVSDVAYCENATATALTATSLSGHTLQWYGTNALGGTASTTAPAPLTITTGTTTFYVSQMNTTTGCEGVRAGITVTVNSLPTTPVVSDIDYCQNTTATILTATASSDHTLLWYGTNSTGGSASTIAPTPSTSTIGTTNYYVSQLNTSTGCESERSSIRVTIQALPAAPVVSDVAYCQNATASSLSALASPDHILLWYDTHATGGTSGTIAPTPSTSAIGTTDYYVSQLSTLAGCHGESERVKISVTINSLPTAPVVLDIAYCQNTTASSIAATALNGHTLLWYGTNAIGGNSSTTAPIPSTASAGTTSYYVSQHNTATGCESERARITVTIKSTPKPIITATGVGTETTLLTSSASSGNQWFKDGVAISGATSQTYSVLDNGVHQVHVTMDGCISELSEPFTVVVTAVADVEPISLKLFPVPARQSINIQLTGVKDDEVSEVMIFDMSGKVVDKQSMRGKVSTLITEEYPAGEYFLRIINRSFLLNSRIIKY